MRLRLISALVTCSCILIVLQLIAFLLNPAIGVAMGVVLPLLSFGFLRFFELDLPSWSGVVIPVACSVTGTLLSLLGRPATDWLPWLAPTLALLCSLAILGILRLRSRRCALCDQRLGDGVEFTCPRCGFQVCDACWIFERIRCRLCEQNGVSILTADARWWDQQLGPTLKLGRCQLCLTQAEEVELRPCRNCGRPQCRSCWDSANGQCNRCGWVVEDIPESLRALMISPAQVAPSARPSQSHR